ncbi:hypothetical protein QIS74_03541 [Colletotrichum tabaci]|uniref:DUF7908 domain-containing protein n=1 Tax=Colletotrichum tabaci TaxID=1209068 RepID=A0AAV9TKW1_9PEZI
MNVRRLAIAAAAALFGGIAGGALLPAENAPQVLCYTYISTYLELGPVGTAGPAPSGSTASTTMISSSVPAAGTSGSSLPSSGGSFTALPTSAPTTSLATTSALTTSAPTTSSPSPTTSTLAVRQVILLVAPVPAPARRVRKRDDLGGFVSTGTDENPQVCSVATVFVLSENQVLAGGQPFFYAGEPFKALRNGGTPPPGAVTTTFGPDADGVLRFTNPVIPNGGASFCQDPANGQVYVTFTSSPLGCVPVVILAYGVEQCQNGRVLQQRPDQPASHRPSYLELYSELGTAASSSDYEQCPPNQPHDILLPVFLVLPQLHHPNDFFVIDGVDCPNNLTDDHVDIIVYSYIYIHNRVNYNSNNDNNTNYYYIYNYTYNNNYNNNNIYYNNLNHRVNYNINNNNLHHRVHHNYNHICHYHYYYHHHPHSLHFNTAPKFTITLDPPPGGVDPYDDGTAQINLPFLVSVYGNNLASVFVEVNGLISNTPSNFYGSGSIPSTDFSPITIAPYYADFVILPAQSQGIWYEISLSPRGGREVTFEFLLTRFASGLSSTYYHFTVTLYENFPNIHNIKYYQTPLKGSDAVIGVQNRIGSSKYVEFSTNQATVPDGTFVEFDTNTLPGSFITGSFPLSC